MKYSDMPPLFLLLFHIGKQKILLWNSNQWQVEGNEESKALEYFRSFKNTYYVGIILLFF